VQRSSREKAEVLFDTRSDAHELRGAAGLNELADVAELSALARADGRPEHLHNLAGRDRDMSFWGHAHFIRPLRWLRSRLGVRGCYHLCLRASCAQAYTVLATEELYGRKLPGTATW
jgi:hypothetical protein